MIDDLVYLYTAAATIASSCILLDFGHLLPGKKKNREIYINTPNNLVFDPSDKVVDLRGKKRRKFPSYIKLAFVTLP